MNSALIWVQLKIKLILETEVFRGTEIKILANTFGARISKLLKRSRSKIDRTSYQKWSIKKGDLRNFVKFIGKHMCRSLFFFVKLQVQSTFFTEPLRVTASLSKKDVCYCKWYEQNFWWILSILLFRFFPQRIHTNGQYLTDYLKILVHWNFIFRRFQLFDN